MTTTTLVILAAGMGSRFGGVKQMEKLGASGETTMEYSLFDALRAGFNEVVFVIRREILEDFRQAILVRLPGSIRHRVVFQEMESLLDHADLKALHASGRAKPWGTAHALLCASRAIQTPFALINADDFYGRESFALVNGFLQGCDPESSSWCMAGFRLRNTCSPHGSVSRGVCRVNPSGVLEKVTEHTAISVSGNVFISRKADGTNTTLDGDELVSMNLWGFSPAIFKYGAGLFNRFLDGNRSSLTAEFCLPTVVDELIRTQGASVTVLPTPSVWFGLTYREDKAAALDRISGYVKDGAFPPSLWGSP